MATWEDVRAAAAALPGTEEGTSWRQPSFRVAGKWFVGMSAHEDGAVVVRCDPDERPLLLEADPQAYYLTAHYEPGGRWLLVRLEDVAPDDLRERVLDSWLLVAPKRLRARWEAEQLAE